ncbi:hypothetical protein [Rhodonellum sp.]|uniref:hypothetical protein n=1 Tax=Rhodonellum sp. TaxID=2231180 RepID=UPI00271CA7BE|nr:hypothetical protein [Rhodonellum sp.]MDO9551124.1 hypothetical protein [Rhodonellum sp.]
MIDINNIDQAISRGLSFIRDQQLPHGEFACEFANSETKIVDDLLEGDDVTLIAETNTLFPNSLIGHALLPLKEEPIGKDILEKLSGFLALHQSKYGLWRHYTDHHPLSRFIPFDLDNTAMASHLLSKLHQEVPDNRALFLSNLSSKGLFYTWITWRAQLNLNVRYWLSLGREFRHPIGQYYFWKLMPCDKGDIDAVVNSNVLLYLGYSEKTEAIVDWMVKVLTESKEKSCDKWYGRPSLVYYFFSKNFTQNIPKLEPMKALVRKLIFENLRGNGQFFDSELDTALAITTLIHASYGHEIPQQSIQFLLNRQQSDGSWGKWVIFYGKPDRKSGFGSKALSSSHVLEALVAYKKYQLLAPKIMTE